MPNKYPIRRKGKTYKTFRYYWKNGRQVKDKKEIKRIRSLGIPPAYRNVKIFKPHSKVQATGVDDKGRLQYRYHPNWVIERDRKKFYKLIAFAKAYPRIRRSIAQTLPKRGPPKTKLQLTALATGILSTCRLRPGHSRHLKNTGSYGTTTLRKKHFKDATVKGKKCVVIRFKGKSGVVNECTVPRIGTLPRTLRALLKTKKRPNDSVFKLKDGTRVTPTDINDYLRSVGGKDVTAKEFRTYHANIRFIQTSLPSLKSRAADTLRGRKKLLKHNMEKLAEELHHTRATLKKSYLFPTLREMFTDRPKDFLRYFRKKNTEKALCSFMRKHTNKKARIPKSWKDERNYASRRRNSGKRHYYE
jgi:DNA topoisomerase-1